MECIFVTCARLFKGVLPPVLPVLTAGDIVVDPGHGHLSAADGIVILIVHHAFNPMMHLGERTAE